MADGGASREDPALAIYTADGWNRLNLTQKYFASSITCRASLV
jgi:hypothetical protein